MTSSSAATSRNLSSALIAEMEQEAKTTRACLERVPADKFDWKPHEKSMAMGGLASHLANLASWTMNAIDMDSLDIAPPDGPPMRLDSTPSGSTIT